MKLQEQRKPRIVHINSVSYGSTGTIMLDLVQEARRAGMEAWALCPAMPNNRSRPNGAELFGDPFELRQVLRLHRFTGREGTAYWFSTRDLLNKLDHLQPDIVHLHNLHENFCDWEMLFTYFKKKNLCVIWTLHDCWTFTGHCPHFQVPPCEQWRTACVKCDRYKEYPWSRVDNAKWQFQYKKRCFTMLGDRMQLVTPSHWLARLVKQSFWKDTSVNVIHNGINLETFRPTPSDLRRKLGLENRFVILAVASPWSYRKGADVLAEVAAGLPEDCAIVAVGNGLQSNDRRLIAYGPVIDKKEMAMLYSMADVFFNPTREDNFPTVTLEALACGTLVVAFDTGGVSEGFDESCGMLLRRKDASAALEALLRLCRQEVVFQRDACLAYAARHDKSACYQAYLKGYQASAALCEAEGKGGDSDD